MVNDDFLFDAIEKADTFILPDNEDVCAGCEKRFNENDVSFYVVIGSDGDPEFWHSECYAENGKTTVIHIEDAPHGWRDNPQYVYIGRRNNRKGLEQSEYHNPYKIGRDGPRDVVINKFRRHVMKPESWYLRYLIPRLRGKTLVCWCKPEACHGDVLAEIADNEAEGMPVTCDGCGITKSANRFGWREIDGSIFCAECADFIEKSEIE